MVDDGYVCPNGHAVDAVRVHNCRTCRASVIYEPLARRMALHAELKTARDLIAELERVAHHAAGCLIDVASAHELQPELARQAQENVHAVGRAMAHVVEARRNG